MSKSFSRRTLLKGAGVGAVGAAVLPKNWLKRIPKPKELGGPVAGVHSAALAYNGRQVTEWQRIRNARVKEGRLYGDDMVFHNRTFKFNEVQINVAGIGVFDYKLTLHSVADGDATVIWNKQGIMRFGTVDDR